MENQQTIKDTVEISSLVEQLSPKNQYLVLNTINALIFSQQINKRYEGKELWKNNN